MTSPSSRRPRCKRASEPNTRRQATEYQVAALAEPDLLYLVVVTLAAGDELSDAELGRLYCDMDKLVPLRAHVRPDRLHYWLLCTAPNPQAAAWKTVAAVRAVPAALLLLVETGLPDAAAPDLVLTGTASPGAESSWDPVDEPAVDSRTRGDNDD